MPRQIYLFLSKRSILVFVKKKFTISAVLFITGGLLILIGGFKLIQFYFYTDQAVLDGFSELAKWMEGFIPIVVGLFLLIIYGIIRILKKRKPKR